MSTAHATTNRTTTEPTMTGGTTTEDVRTDGTAPAGTGTGTTPPRRRRRGLRAVLVVGATLAGLAGVGATAQHVTMARADAAFPMPGRTVEVDGRAVHVHATGDTDADRTVVLISGLGAPATAWAWVQDVLDDDAHVVSYDRAGLGWSDPADGAVDPARTVADLHAALEAVEAPEPYVVVGHSLGGHIARLYADTHPEQVEGVVLLDPSHEDQFVGAPELQAQLDQTHLMIRLTSAASRLGLTTLVNPLGAAAAGLPDDVADHYSALIGSPRGIDGAAAEMGAIDVFTEAVRGTTLPDVPLRVVSAGTAQGGPQEVVDRQVRLHASMTELSDDARHDILSDADHYTIVTEREHAGAVADAVATLLDELDAR